MFSIRYPFSPLAFPSEVRGVGLSLLRRDPGGWFAKTTQEESRRAGARAPDPSAVSPTTHTAYLPCLRDFCGLASLGLSLLSPPPEPPKLRSSRGPTPGVSGGWGTHQQLHNALGCASERLFLCRHSWAGGPLPQPVLPTSSPSIWCSIFSLPSSDPALWGSWCPGSDLTLLIYSSFPRAKG